MNCKSILETEASLIIFKEQVLSILYECDKNSICTIIKKRLEINGFKSGLKMDDNPDVNLLIGRKLITGIIIIFQTIYSKQTICFCAVRRVQEAAISFLFVYRVRMESTIIHNNLLPSL